MASSAPAPAPAPLTLDQKLLIQILLAVLSMCETGTGNVEVALRRAGLTPTEIAAIWTS